MKRVRNWLLCAIAIVLTATCMAACAGSCRKPTEPQTYTVSYAAGGV